MFANWKHKKSALKVYNDLKNKYNIGAPSYISNKRGGLAMWLKDKLKEYPFEEIMLRDEWILHKCPAAHHDFLYSSVRVSVPPQKMCDLKKLSGSVWYDGLKKLLTARCQSLEANIATIKLATDIINGKLTIERIHNEGLYALAIGSTKDPEVVEGLLNDIVKNLRQNRKLYTFTKGHWRGAFSDDKCTRPLKQTGGFQVSDKVELQFSTEKKCRRETSKKFTKDKPERRAVPRIMRERKLSCLDALKVYKKKQRTSLRKKGILSNRKKSFSNMLFYRK